MVNKILKKIGFNAKKASLELSKTNSHTKNKAIKCVADEINKKRKNILLVNSKDVEMGIKKKLSESMLDRLMVNG